jgi:hypothetical protein
LWRQLQQQPPTPSCGPPCWIHTPCLTKRCEPAPEVGADGRTQIVQTTGGHDVVLSCQFGAVSPVPLPPCPEAIPGLETVLATETADVSSRACAAVRGGGKGYHGRGGEQRGRGEAKPAASSSVSSAAPAAAAPKDPTPSALARLASGLCFFHWNFADRATKCSLPCSWGN